MSGNMAGTFEAITGKCPLMPSSSASPRPSARDGMVQMSNARMYCRAISLNPSKWARPLRPRRSISAARRDSSRPAPMIASWVFGYLSLSAAKACSK
ncbi:hypothetical protein D9M72_555330 [compost metagenome]